jgi:hypothetical protein
VEVRGRATAHRRLKQRLIHPKYPAGAATRARLSIIGNLYPVSPERQISDLDAGWCAKR